MVDSGPGIGYDRSARRRRRNRDDDRQDHERDERDRQGDGGERRRVSTRAVSLNTADVITVSRSRQTRPAPMSVRPVQQPLATAAELTGTRHEVVDDDDSEL